MPFAPRFSYGPGPTVLNMMHSSELGTPERDFVGGMTESGAGVPETYIIRKEGLWSFNLRVDETEWPSFLTMIEWIIGAGSLGNFSFYPDQNNLAAHGAPINSWLIKPQAGMQLGITRHSDYPSVLITPMIIKTVSKVAFDVRIRPV